MSDYITRGVVYLQVWKSKLQLEFNQLYLSAEIRICSPQDSPGY